MFVIGIEWFSNQFYPIPIDIYIAINFGDVKATDIYITITFQFCKLQRVSRFTAYLRHRMEGNRNGRSASNEARRRWVTTKSPCYLAKSKCKGISRINRLISEIRSLTCTHMKRAATPSYVVQRPETHLRCFKRIKRVFVKIMYR